MTRQIEATKPNVTLVPSMNLGSRTANQFLFRVESGCLDFVTLQCNLGASNGAVSFRLGFTRAEYLELNPNSGMERCGDLGNPYVYVYPIERGLNMNVAFTVPTGDWARQTIADDAKAFFNYMAPPKTPGPMSAAMSLSTSALTGLSVFYLALA